MIARDFTPDIGILYLVPHDRARAAVALALAGVEYDDLYRAGGGAADDRLCVWQIETHLAPHIARQRVEARGFEVVSIQAEQDGPLYVRFAWPYANDNEWPAAPYYPRPADWPVWPWERAPLQPRTDAVAGPGGVVLCDLDTTPAALIPVPGVPGLDYTYAEMGMVEPAPVVVPEPEPAPAAHTIRFGQRDLPVAQVIRTAAGSVYARVDISTTARPMWHHVLIARMVTRAESKAA